MLKEVAGLTFCVESPRGKGNPVEKTRSQKFALQEQAKHCPAWMRHENEKHWRDVPGCLSWRQVTETGISHLGEAAFPHSIKCLCNLL